MPAARPVAIFGGTFDPVHFGHLRSALDLVESLDLAELRFMPAAAPPHREPPVASAGQRAAMLELAIAGEPRLYCDRRELQRSGPSYTVLSLRELRAELGAARPLCLVVGADALAGLRDWYCWQELFELAHLVALARPGWASPGRAMPAPDLAARCCTAQALAARPAGGLLLQALRPWDISASAIRGLLQSGRSARYLLPDRVLDYIADHALYRGRHATQE
jgi:nicotinate-nucleotide adenylyltransferase